MHFGFFAARMTVGLDDDNADADDEASPRLFRVSLSRSEFLELEVELELELESVPLMPWTLFVPSLFPPSKSSNSC